jgi:hypothetical protein
LQPDVAPPLSGTATAYSIVNLGGNSWLVWSVCQVAFGADLCRLTLAVQVTIVEDADQRKSVYQIAPVLVLHQLAEQFSSGLQLAWGEVLLPADHEDHVLDHGVVQLLLRRGVDRLREVDARDNGADVLLNLLDLHSLHRNHPRDIVHDLVPRL